MGTYSPGNESVVYEISIQVLPTVPSPTTTHLIGLPEDISLTFIDKHNTCQRESSITSEVETRIVDRKRRLIRKLLGRRFKGKEKF